MTNNTIGGGSILTTVGLKASDKAEIIELSNCWSMSSWGMPDWALLISMIAGLTFIASNIIIARVACKKKSK